MESSTSVQLPSESFLLQWGSSIEVSQDLRRTIEREIKTIDQDVISLNSSIDFENKKKSQHNRDLSHAKNEIIDLWRCASDEKDNAFMNEEIFNKLKDSSEKEVLKSVALTVSPTRGPSQEDNSKSEINTYVDDFNKVKKSMMDDVVLKTHDIQLLASSASEKKRKISENDSKLSQICLDLDCTKERIDRETKNETNWISQVESRRREHSIEVDRIMKAKKCLMNSRKSTEDYTRQYTKNLDTLIALKEEHKPKEKSWQSENSLREGELSACCQQLATLNSNNSNLSQQIGDINQRFFEYYKIKEERAILSQERLQTKMEKNMSTKREAELSIMLSQLKEDVNSNQNELDLVTKQSLALEEKCNSNKDETKNIIERTREDMRKLQEEGENLSTEIVTLQEEAVSSKISDNAELLEDKAKLDDLKSRVAKLRVVAEEKNSLLSNIQKDHMRCRDAWEQELCHHNSFKLKYEDDKRIHTEFLKELGRQYDEIQEKDRHKRIRLDAERAKLQILEKMKEILVTKNEIDTDFQFEKL